MPLRRNAVAFLCIFGGCISALIVKVRFSQTGCNHRNPRQIVRRRSRLKRPPADFKTRNQAAAATSARQRGIWHAVIARGVRFLFRHGRRHLSAPRRSCNCLGVRAASHRLCSFERTTDAYTRFALDACSRRYLNRQHSIAQLVAGCLLGTINCGLTAAAVHRNTAAVAEFDAFLKSAQGKFRSATPRFFVKIVLKFGAGAGLSLLLGCAAAWIVFRKEMRRWLKV